VLIIVWLFRIVGASETLETTPSSARVASARSSESKFSASSSSTGRLQSTSYTNAAGSGIGNTPASVANIRPRDDRLGNNASNTSSRSGSGSGSRSGSGSDRSHDLSESLGFDPQEEDGEGQEEEDSVDEDSTSD
jgi:hypothetical protein